MGRTINKTDEDSWISIVTKPDNPRKGTDFDFSGRPFWKDPVVDGLQMVNQLISDDQPLSSRKIFENLKGTEDEPGPWFEVPNEFDIRIPITAEMQKDDDGKVYSEQNDPFTLMQGLIDGKKKEYARKVLHQAAQIVDSDEDEEASAKKKQKVDPGRSRVRLTIRKPPAPARAPRQAPDPEDDEVPGANEENPKGDDDEDMEDNEKKDGNYDPEEDDGAEVEGDHEVEGDVPNWVHQYDLPSQHVTRRVKSLASTHIHNFWENFDEVAHEWTSKDLAFKHLFHIHLSTTRIQKSVVRHYVNMTLLQEFKRLGSGPMTDALFEKIVVGKPNTRPLINFNNQFQAALNQINQEELIERANRIEANRGIQESSESGASA